MGRNVLNQVFHIFLIIVKINGVYAHKIAKILVGMKKTPYLCTRKRNKTSRKELRHTTGELSENKNRITKDS